MTRYLVIRESKCEVCEGEGHYYNPEWGEAFAAWDNSDNVSVSQKEIERASQRMTDFWIKEGYGSNPIDWPPEEVECCECTHGIVREEIPLAEALQAIKEEALQYALSHPHN